MKSLSRAFQGYSKGPTVVDPDYDDAYNKFMDTLKATDQLVNHLGQFEKNAQTMKTNMNNIITIVEKTFPPRAVPHEVALDARSIVDQYTLHSENFDRAFTILKEFQKFLHELQEKTKRRKKIKEEYEHYSGKAKDLQNIRDEAARYQRAAANAEKFGLQIATLTSKIMLEFKVLIDIRADIFTRALVGFMDANAHNQVVAPCQNFVDMYRSHTEDPWPDLQDAIANAGKAGEPQDNFDEFDDAPYASPSTSRANVSQASAYSSQPSWDAPAAAPAPVAAAAPRAAIPMVRALYDFTPSRDDELPLKAGDFVVVVREIDQDWSLGRCAGKEGLFPISYTEKMF